VLRLPLLLFPGQELDEQLYEQCRLRWQQEEQQQRTKDEQRRQEWSQLQQRAVQQATSRGLPNGAVAANGTYKPLLLQRNRDRSPPNHPA
jgi:hypothetical protein